MGYSWRKDFKSPGTQFQVLRFALLTLLAGALGLLGLFGDAASTRAISAGLVLLGVLLAVLAWLRLKR